jgi:hypothetical protein
MDNPRGSIPWQARATCGFILAPIIAALLLELPSMLARDPSLPAYIAYLLKVGYLALLVLGVPAYLLSRRLRWSGLPAYVAFGALLGCVTYLVIFAAGAPLAAPGALYAALARLRYLPLGVLYGVLVLAGFWLIARPDRR